MLTPMTPACRRLEVFGSLIRANLLIGLILESHVRILSSEWTKWCNRPRTDRGVARSRKAASGQDESRREEKALLRDDMMDHRLCWVSMPFRSGIIYYKVVVVTRTYCAQTALWYLTFSVCKLLFRWR